MKIELDDEIAKKCGLDEREALKLRAISIYKNKGIHGALAGKILGISEFEDPYFFGTGQIYSP